MYLNLQFKIDKGLLVVFSFYGLLLALVKQFISNTLNSCLVIFEKLQWPWKKSLNETPNYGQFANFLHRLTWEKSTKE